MHLPSSITHGGYKAVRMQLLRQRQLLQAPPRQCIAGATLNLLDYCGICAS